MRFARLTVLAIVTVAACTQAPPPEEPAATPDLSSTATTASVATGIVDRDWALVSLGDRPNPPGAGGRAVTLRVETAPTPIAAGFAGCNRYTGSYTLSGDSITFGPSVSTKMACAEGMDVEQAYLAMLPNVTTYSVADSTLVLSGATGPLATYRNRPAQ